MAPHRHQLFAPVVLASVTLLHGSAAWAEDPIPPPPPAPPASVPPYQVQPAQRPVYVAPLSQDTQSTYVPQSVALSGPKQLEPLDDVRPPPDGYTAVQRRRKGLLVGGGVMFGVSYGIAVLTAAAGDDAAKYHDGKNELAAMWIPVAGPFIQALDTESTSGKVFLIGFGATELIGAAMLYVGLTSTKRMFVRNDLVGSMKVTPMAGPGSTGVALSGRF